MEQDSHAIDKGRLGPLSHCFDATRMSLRSLRSSQTMMQRRSSYRVVSCSIVSCRVVFGKSQHEVIVQKAGKSGKEFFAKWEKRGHSFGLLSLRCAISLGNIGCVWKVSSTVATVLRGMGEDVVPLSTGRRESSYQQVPLPTKLRLGYPAMSERERVFGS
ncbi:hypothetical protein K504DRAFT_222820 [Pleomassaria siparia CBS 279.74]|uniref:Uncharacterized protein n=1 Tax=Pleomassaria siparia CBS 279.74 TaxID=1314801 RepID=A0A6G1KGP2_9PLEO|nr:hypothetical protein K504DRAFT_222820 [Pleomassaria siparia CBS 279.74]